MGHRRDVALQRRGVAGRAFWLVVSSLAHAGCLPNSGDLGQYSADWSPPPPELEQQTALPNQATDGASSQQPAANANGDATSTANSSSSGPAAAEPSAANSEQLPTPIVQPPSSQGGSGAATGEPTATDPSSSDPAPVDPTAPQAPTAQEQCADGVLDAAQASCYLVATVRATWQVARADCTTWGGSLVKVETPAEDQLMAQLVTEDMWLGASDTAAENVFVWTDGSPILYGNWGPSQPDRFPGPDCVQKRSTDGRQWFDQPCDNQWLYVCEKPIAR